MTRLALARKRSAHLRTGTRTTSVCPSSGWDTQFRLYGSRSSFRTPGLRGKLSQRYCVEQPAYVTVQQIATVAPHLCEGAASGVCGEGSRAAGERTQGLSPSRASFTKKATMPMTRRHQYKGESCDKHLQTRTKRLVMHDPGMEGHAWVYLPGDC